jgi:5-hydroxyisourate hydrolase
MPGKLTTHVIDTARGLPASGIRVELHRIENSTLTFISCATTSPKGRTDQPLLEGDAMISGVYELHFHLGNYFKEGFLEIVPVRFRITKCRRALSCAAVVFPLVIRHLPRKLRIPCQHIA